MLVPMDFSYMGLRVLRNGVFDNTLGWEVFMQSMRHHFSPASGTLARCKTISFALHWFKQILAGILLNSFCMGCCVSSSSSSSHLICM